MAVEIGVQALAVELRSAEELIVVIILMLVTSFAAASYDIKVHSNSDGKSHIGFWQGNEYRYSLIMNRSDVLFYLRRSAAAVELPAALITGGSHGERTVRLRDLKGTEELLQHLSLHKVFRTN